MNNFTVFVDSLCISEPYFDEKFETKICSNIRKIYNFFVNCSEIYSNSCLNGIKFKTVLVNLILCDNDKIQKINKEYRNVDKPTDVISFALFADTPEDEKFIFDGEINLGDIFLSLETAKVQAEENKVSFFHEFYYLVSHSLLHLLGFDHQTDIDYDFMVRMQNLSLEQINE